jgi:hypothetical protein
VPEPALLPRLARAWRACKPDERLAAFAALGLFLSMLLPWYQQNAVVTGRRAEPLVSQNLSAFGVFSFVEAAVLLVALAVLALLFARAERRTFHLPGGDGSVVMAAGLWAAALLVWRLFDKPGIATRGVAANVGVQWGIFFALGAAGVLAYAGSRMRRARRPEPPLVARPRVPRVPGPANAAPGTTMTRVLPPESGRLAPREAPPARPAPLAPRDAAPAQPPQATPRAARRPSVPEDQLTMGLDADQPDSPRPPER